MLTHRYYELLDEAACRDLLYYSHVGRIALSIGALPAIVPVTYVVDGDSVVFRTATGTPLPHAGNSVLAFEVGHIDPTGEAGWSVLAVGVAIEVTDPAIRMRLALEPAHPWVLSDKDQLFRLPLDLVSGTRIVAEAEAEA